MPDHRSRPDTLPDSRAQARPEPTIAAFVCTWCTYTAADLAGICRLRYAPNVRMLRLNCTGRVDPQFVLAAFRHGAEGVLIGGCHPGDCHYQDGNSTARRRVELLRAVLRDLGVEDARLRLEWISASEGEKVQRVCNGMTEQLRHLSPLRRGPLPVIATLTTPVGGGQS